MRLGFAHPFSPPGAAWWAVGVSHVVELEAMTLGALRSAARAHQVAPRNVRALWVNTRACDLSDPLVHHALVAATWRALLRPARAMAISSRLRSTSLVVVGEGPVCRSGDGRGQLWTPNGADALVTNLATLIDAPLSDDAGLVDVAAALHAVDALDVFHTEA